MDKIITFEVITNNINISKPTVIKKIVAVVTLPCYVVVGFAQVNWITKQIGNNLSVKLPAITNYKLVDKHRSYIKK